MQKQKYLLLKQLLLVVTLLPLAMFVNGCSDDSYANVGDDDSEVDETPSSPFTLADQGSFFIGGETKSRADDDDITIHQMYVEYQKPWVTTEGVPIVFTHGCCLSSMTWETTPDGRMGWSEYFVRLGHPVYLTDQVSRARSGFDATPFNLVRSGEADPGTQPEILQASHQFAWSVFRFGPFEEPFGDLQYPIEAVDELYKQMIPDVNSGLPDRNPTWANLAELSEKVGGAVLVGHSESGVFPFHAALINPNAVKAVVNIEAGGTCHENFGVSETGETTDQAIKILASMPVLMLYGDYLDRLGGSWQDAFQDCQKLVQEINDAGGNATMIHLPELGIVGNSHMMMQARNNLEIADLIEKWIQENVE